ncbi:MAG: hypothetical protein WCE56_08360 [Desulfobacterales bacterium]
MKKTFSIGLFLTTFLLFNSCDAPLNEYKPKSDDEKQIIALLNIYLDACNKKDLKRYASYLSQRRYILRRERCSILKTPFMLFQRVK